MGKVASFPCAKLLVSLRIPDRWNRPFCASKYQIEREKRPIQQDPVSQKQKAVDPRDTKYGFGRTPFYSIGIDRVGFFSSLFENRTSSTPFL
jgi:hypothetical protein